MRICIIGSGATGLLLSILLKQKKKNDEVFVVEKNNKIAKKLYATGNGKCNLGNLYYSIRKNIFNDDFALNLI